MKKVFTLILLGAFFSFFGCSEDESPDQQIIGNWELIESTGVWTVEIPSEETDYFVSYKFNKDGTFLKTKILNGVERSATGDFNIITNDRGAAVNLTFESGVESIESCTSSSGTEFFLLKSKNRLEGTWSYCDGSKNIFAKR